MQRYTSLILASAALLAPQLARAQQTLCVPDTEGYCVEAMFTLSSDNTINAFVFNGPGSNGAVQSVLTQFALGGLPAAGTWSLASTRFNDWNGTSVVTDGSNALPSNGGWQGPVAAFADLGMAFQTGASGPGGNGGISTCAGPVGGSGTKYRTCDGAGASFGAQDDWFEFSFAYSAGGLSQATLDNLTWGFKAQSAIPIPGPHTPFLGYECSTVSTSDKFCLLETVGAPKDVVPEPATMTLMALAVAGMAAANLRRKRS
jgi:hypothetical protein